jgi:monothiol glutaredoxin
MTKPKIIAYLKPSCGWSQGVRAILGKYELPYEDRDIINDPAQRQEMIEKSGQMLSPCVEVNGHMLADISGDEVEAYLLANKLVGTNDRQPDAPTNQPCAHEMPAAAPLQFRR